MVFLGEYKVKEVDLRVIGQALLLPRIRHIRVAHDGILQHCYIERITKAAYVTAEPDTATRGMSRSLAHIATQLLAQLRKITRVVIKL